MKTIFELPSKSREPDAIEFIREFITYNSNINGTGGMDIDNYDEWLEKTLSSHHGKELRKKYVPASTFFAVIEETNRIVGMVNIRHSLNKDLIDSGSGHIGYSVRPTERGKGYATRMLNMAITYARDVLNINDIFIGCNKTNLASRRVIEKNGGHFVRTIQDDKEETLEYVIKKNI